MPANTNHMCFKQPTDDRVPLWRYLDFTKLVSMVESSSLFFPRANMFSDPFEGSYSRPTSAERPALVGVESFPAIVKTMRERTKWLREWTHVNCWHMNEHESAAMWSLYCRTKEAVAVRTSYGLLRDALPDHVKFGIVQYFDYQSDQMPSSNTYWPYVCKRRSYEHEREVRAIIRCESAEDGTITIGTRNPDSGIMVRVDLANIVQSVYVAPSAPAWFTKLTKSILAKFSLNVEVRQSSLDDSPVY